MCHRQVVRKQQHWPFSNPVRTTYSLFEGLYILLQIVEQLLRYIVAALIVFRSRRSASGHHEVVEQWVFQVADAVSAHHFLSEMQDGFRRNLIIGTSGSNKYRLVNLPQGG